MKSLWFWLLLFPAALLIVLATVFWFFRYDLADDVLDAALSASGIDDFSYRIEQIESSGLVLSGLRLRDQITFSRITLDLSKRRLVVDRPVVRADVRAGEAPFVEKLLGSSGQNESGSLDLSWLLALVPEEVYTLEIRDGTLELNTDEGRLFSRFGGEALAKGLAFQRASFTLSDLEQERYGALKGGLSLVVEAETIDLLWDFTSFEGSDLPSSAGRFSVRSEAGMPVGNLSFTVQKGAYAGELEGSLSLAVDRQENESYLAETLVRAAQERAAVRLDLVNSLTLPGERRLNLSLGGELRFEAGAQQQALAFRLMQPFSASTQKAEAFSPYLSGPALMMLDSGPVLRLAENAENQWGFRLDQEAGLSLDLATSKNDLFETQRLSVPLSVTELAAEFDSNSGQVEKLVLQLQQKPVTLKLRNIGNLDLGDSVFEARVEGTDVSLMHRLQDGMLNPLSPELEEVVFSAVETRIAGALGPEPTLKKFEIRAGVKPTVVLEGQALQMPLAAVFEAQEENGKLGLSGSVSELTSAEPVEVARWSGQADPVSGKWRMEVRAASSSLSKEWLGAEGLGLIALLPESESLEKLAGEYDLQVSLEGEAGAYTGFADLDLMLNQFSYGGQSFSGFRLDGTLSRFEPPIFPLGQSVRIDKLDVSGIPLGPLSARFGLFGSGQPALVLEEVTLKAADGQLSVRPVTVRLGQVETMVELLVEAVDLRTVFDLVGREHLDGTGTLSGMIPVHRLGDAFAIDNAVLASDGPGRLSLRSEAVKQALGGGGEQVELLLKALQDFRYSSLRLVLNKPMKEDQAAVLTLELKGSNPDVLDGYPFAININLETRVEPLLEAFLLGQSVSQGLLQQLAR